MDQEDPYPLGRESELVDRIRKATSHEERNQLISELERLPVRWYPFFTRWILIHEVFPFHCWSENGFDPSLSPFPRDVLLLAATDYGKADIDNGGLHQFFFNGTGTFAPEMIEWFQRSELPETAAIIREAVAVFGTDFPRSQGARQHFLATFEGTERAEWDPFYEMDDRFYDSLSDDQEKNLFDKAADRWLREVCGIKSLHDRCSGSTM